MFLLLVSGLHVASNKIANNIWPVMILFSQTLPFCIFVTHCRFCEDCFIIFVYHLLHSIWYLARIFASILSDINKIQPVHRLSSSTFASLMCWKIILLCSRQLEKPGILIVNQCIRSIAPTLSSLLWQQRRVNSLVWTQSTGGWGSGETPLFGMGTTILSGIRCHYSGNTMRKKDMRMILQVQNLRAGRSVKGKPVWADCAVDQGVQWSVIAEAVVTDPFQEEQKFKEQSLVGKFSGWKLGLGVGETSISD